MNGPMPRPVMGCAMLNHALELLGLIEEMRQEEGVSITIFCDNPDFGGPNSGVDVSFDFSEMPTRFSGDSVLDAIRSAHTAWKVRRNA